MTGTPVPYNMLNDNMVMTMFVLNIIGISYVFLMNGASILERLKCMFYYESKSTPYNDRTHITRICNVLMYGQTAFYTMVIVTKLLSESGVYSAANGTPGLFGIILLLFLAVLLFKYVSYNAVNNILFTKQQSQRWSEVYFFTLKLLGFVLAPAGMTILFAHDRFINFVKFYLLFALLIYSYTVFNNLRKIIFTQRRNYLDIFLYLCALEFLPMGIVWKFALQMSEFLTAKI
ncbi:MAG: DUF4271 domain-containing protein [Bacteroidaceae bacterium]|nr:DUF4271 domain-containing protein [Bacteroidaceae bacterium]